MVLAFGALLGVATTSAVALVIAHRAPTFKDSISPPRWSHSSGTRWLFREQSSFGATRIRGQMGRGATTAPTTIEVVRPPHWSALSQQSTPANWGSAMWEEAHGWPQRALMARVDGSYGAPVRIIGGVELGPHPRDWGSRLYLPALPIWRGFVFNTLAYSAVWCVVLFSIIRTGRTIWTFPRRLRARRGRCPQCNYDLRGKLDDGCSECGWRRAERVVADR